MLYITGMQALNIPCALRTGGDWHQSSMDWQHLNLKESDTGFFQEYGIEGPKKIPQHERLFFVANHLRAVLDLLDAQDFCDAGGMRRDYIGNDEYDDELFSQVLKMRNLPKWPAIDRFMEKEYLMKWVNFRREQNHESRHT